jgi:hypothetical protein
VAALTQARRVYVPRSNSNFYLLFDGIALHESGVPPGGLTVPRLMRENIRLWLRPHARRIALWGLSLTFVLATLLTYLFGVLETRDLLLSMVVPLVFLLIDRLLQRRQANS